MIIMLDQISKPGFTIISFFYIKYQQIKCRWANV